MGGHIKEVVERARHGGTVRVLVLGGSMTAGRGCVSQVQDKTCAWPARVNGWLNATFPNAKVDVSNWAMGGWNAGVWGQSLGLRVFLMGDAKDTVDIVFFETAINDYERKVKGPEYEALLRLIIECFPKATPFGVLVIPHWGYDLVQEQEGILDHYDVPRINFNRDVLLQLDTSVWGSGAHPDWHKHQHVADLVTTTIGKAVCQSTSWDRPRFAHPLGGGKTNSR